MATVNKNGKSFEVKNLGWLLRHSKEVGWLKVSENPGDREGAILVAHLTGGVTYSTTFGSTHVLYQWLERRVFSGCPVEWTGYDNKGYPITQNYILGHNAPIRDAFLATVW